jgi:hypothetical protein
MSPSILQLQAIGLQDAYLTKDPQINIFKYIYYKYVNFATETFKLDMNDTPQFGHKISCIIQKRGHLLSKLHLQIRLPKLVKNGGIYACWSDTIGYAIFNGPIELQIGGVIVDRLYPEFLNAWDELANVNKRDGTNLMLLKSDTYVSNYYNAGKDVDLIIPLDFWFTKQYNSALPILSMSNQEIKINFRLRNFEQCVNYDGLEPHYVDIIDSNLFAEYIYLDDIVLNEFQKQKHLFLIDQVQYNGDEMINSNSTVHNTTLKFNHPCKEVLFFCSENENIENNNYFAYSKTPGDTPLIKSASLLLDGKLRFDNLPEYYYRTIFAQNAHSNIPLKYIYVMPFSIRPEDNQPTGSLNMSRFNDVTLSLNLEANNPKLKLSVYSLTYNIVKIESGLLTMEFVI